MTEDGAPPVVQMRDIVKTFPGVRALDGVSLTVRQGEIHALVGKNGAGKSTLMHILTGLYAPDSGTIRIKDETFDSLTTARAKRAGIALVAQHAKFVPTLSIAENVFSGALPLRRGGFVDWGRVKREAAERLARFGLDIDVDRRIETTSVAERQMIEIARALFADASLIILDEPTAPLPKHDVAKLFSFVRRQQASGASFIYISHYLEELFEVADHATVLRNGKVVGSAKIAELTQPQLIRMISGATVERFRRQVGSHGAPALEIRRLTRPRAYFGLNLTLHAGEVVGLTGLEGSGPGALARGLFGLEPLGAGDVRLDGRPYAAGDPSRALRRGLAYLPRDRHGLGIVAMRSVRDNVSLSVLRRLAGRLGLIDGRKERKLVDRFIDALGIKTPSAATALENLSGGNQQKVVVAKLVATEPRVLFLDEPTQGVDVQAKVEILRIVDDLSRSGVAIAIVSDELAELMDVCDRILVFYRGEIIREIRKGSEDFTHERLLDAIEGGAVESIDAVA
jgi:ABC-type sugar transport system ATPase subunit